MGDESGFPLMAIFNAAIVISPLDIKLSEESGILELVNGVRDKGKGIGIANSMFVQVAIVLTGTESFIFLFNEEKRRCLRRVRGMDLSAVKVFLKEVFHGFSFVGGEGIYFSNLRGERIIEVDFMVV